MKSTLFLSLGALALLLLPEAGRAQESAPPQRTPMVEVEAQFVHATRQQLRDALGTKEELVDTRSLAPEELEKVISALKAANAEFFCHSRAVAKSGQRASIESVRELRYPVEYVPSKEDPAKVIPAKFETRNVGVTLELEPIVNPNGAIDLNLVPQLVKFLGFIDSSVAKPGLESNHPDALGELAKAPLKEGGVWTPIFSTRKITTSVSMFSGQSVILYGPPVAPNGHSKGSDPEFWIFITARIVGR